LNELADCRGFQGFKPPVSSGRHESASKENFPFLEKESRLD
jgi:hypothetical protein